MIYCDDTAFSTKLSYNLAYILPNSCVSVTDEKGTG